MSMPAEKLDNMTLDDLLQGLSPAPPVPVRGLASDSRRVTAGDLFLACAGGSSHGLDYLAEVVAAGAVAVAYDASTAGDRTVEAPVPVIGVPGLAGQVGEIANRFFARPSAAVNVIGVTGTNGKTTVAWLLRQCLAALRGHCGYIGTLGSGVDEVVGGDGLTTPDTVELHRLLAGFRDSGARDAAIEVSSHALAQDRVAGIGFEAVLFTNLSRDHLDYHGDMQAYGEAKARLFTACPARHRIINIDTDFGAELAARCGRDVTTVSTSPERDAHGRPRVLVRAVTATAAGSRARVASDWGDAEFELPLPGDYNVANAALVMACLLTMGIELDAATAAIAGVSAPPGRMQRVPGADGAPAVYVDYAHTPDALDRALAALQAHCDGKLWCVFGCGGGRDAGKRPQMGRVAERRAHNLVVTSDNPRDEAPGTIIADILAGLTRPATTIEDRATAIAHAIAAAAPRDCVLIAGKGHETFQVIGRERREFSDYATARAALAVRAGEPA